MMKALLLLGLALVPAIAHSACPAADPNDDRADDAALQACLDQGGTIRLSAGYPGYVIASGLKITKNGTILTSEPSRLRSRPKRQGDEDAGPLAADSARILAAPAFRGTLLAAGGAVTDYRISRIIFDGNLPNRTLRNECKEATGIGPNLSLEGRRFKVDRIASTRAMCGSAMVVLGKDFEISNSLIADNGRGAEDAPGVPTPWADGMTVLLCDNGKIHHNTLVDNTDIALVVGGGANCQVHDNVISNQRKHCFAGLNVGNFNRNGVHTGSRFYNNRISSEKDMLVWGLLLGSHPWDRKVQVFDAGTVSGNIISGAMVNLAIDGIEDGIVTGNRFSKPQGTYGYGTSGPGAKDGCQKAADYTAADFGKAKVQGGFIHRAYHDGACPDLGTGEAPEPESRTPEL